MFIINRQLSYNKNICNLDWQADIRPVLFLNSSSSKTNKGIFFSPTYFGFLQLTTNISSLLFLSEKIFPIQNPNEPLHPNIVSFIEFFVYDCIIWRWV